MLGRQHPKRWELEFTARNIPQIARHDRIGLRSHRQLDEVVVGALKQHGYRFLRAGAGSHELWTHRRSNQTVPEKCRRDTSPAQS